VHLAPDSLHISPLVLPLIGRHVGSFPEDVEFVLTTRGITYVWWWQLDSCHVEQFVGSNSVPVPAQGSYNTVCRLDCYEIPLTCLCRVTYVHTVVSRMYYFCQITRLGQNSENYCLDLQWSGIVVDTCLTSTHARYERVYCTALLSLCGHARYLKLKGGTPSCCYHRRLSVNWELLSISAALKKNNEKQSIRAVNRQTIVPNTRRNHDEFLATSPPVSYSWHFTITSVYSRSKAHVAQQEDMHC
jgi:hypothetical protein